MWRLDVTESGLFLLQIMKGLSISELSLFPDYLEAATFEDGQSGMVPCTSIKS